MTKTRLTHEQWVDFVNRLNRVRTALDKFIATFPNAVGLRHTHAQQFVACQDFFDRLYFVVETEFLKQHPGKSYSFIHTWRREEDNVEHSKVKCTISKEDWIKIGNEIKRIRLDLMGLGGEIERCSTKASWRKFDKAVSKINLAKASLESMIHLQHPDWDFSTRVFFGDIHDRTRADQGDQID